MNWESIIFYKMYKTNKYKFNPPNFIKLTSEEKLNLYSTINNQIKELDLNNIELYENILNINVNKNCALYHIYSDNKTHYFSYQLNNMFYFYSKFIFYGRELIKSEKWFDVNILSKWEKYLIHLFFLKEINLDLLMKEIETHLNDHLKDYSFILGNISYLDIILLSIIIDLDIYDNILKDINKNMLFIKKWIKSFNNIYNIDKEKIVSSFKQKEKENMYYTYRLTSSNKLVKAVESFNYEIVENLLSKEHENVESRREKDYKSLVHIACANADKTMLKILMKYGCNINSLDYENMTPLYDALCSNNINFVKYLIEDLKMDINHKEIQNRTPFYWACCKSNIDIIKYIMSFPDVDINFPSLMGRTALSKSCWNGQLEVVKILCSQEKINTINKPDSNNRTPLHNAVWGEFGGREGKKMPAGSPTDSPEIVQLLIDNGAELEIKDNDGNTPFMISASTNGIESMKILIKYNINLNEINNNYETALIQAVKYGCYESVQILINYHKIHLGEDNNIDLNKGDKEGYTPIEYAILYKKVLCLKLLLENIYDSKYNLEKKINDLIILTIRAKSKLCFNYLFKKLINEYNIEDNEFIDILKLILIYENISFFNFILDNLKEEKIVNLININKELVLYLLISEMILNKKYNIKENQTLSNQKNDDMKKLTEEEKEKIFEEILTKKMSKLTKEELELINESNNENENIEEIILFLNRITIILNKIYFQESQNELIDQNIIAYLIISNKTKEFLSLMKNYSNKTIFKKYIEVKFDQHQFYLIKTGKHNIIKELYFDNKENSIWYNVINDINNKNILFISIEKENEVFFNELIKHEIFIEYIFDTLSNSKRNIFHFLLENFNKDIFDKIINIIENKLKNDNNNIVKNKFLSLINQSDLSFMTPLDIVINKDNDEILYLYTNTINNLFKKYFQNLDLIQKPIVYKILKFKISSKPYNIDPSYIKKITNDYIACKKFIQKCKSFKENKETNAKDYSFDKEYEQSKYFINEECIKNIKNIIDLILENKIEDEFKIVNLKYLNSFIDTEEKIIQMRNEIINESVLGVDAEFTGEKCGIDGVVCIIQISSNKKTYVVDTLKLHNLIKKYLGDIFENENIIKIFHGCDNDLFWILSNFDIKTINIYDTSRSFAVFQELINNKSYKNSNYVSLYHLIIFFLGIKLNKSYQKSNWKIRPLNGGMYQYALNDAKSVLYLYYLFQGLYLYLNKQQFTESKYNNFYFDIKKNFYKNKEKASQAKFDDGNNYYKSCLTKIKFMCLDMIKNRINNKINQINIELENN